MSDNGIGNVVIDPESEEISTAPAKVSAQQEQKFFDRGQREYDLEHHKQSLGTLGIYFGSGQAASTNIAGVLVVSSLIGLMITFAFPINDPTGARTLLVGLISSASGYLFGSNTKG